MKMFFATIMVALIVVALESWAGWIVQPISSADGTATFSFTLDKARLPHVSWFSGNEINYSKRTGSLWTTQPIERLGYMVKGDNSIAVDKDNHPHISYCDENTQSLKYAEWTGISWTTKTIDAEMGDYKMPVGLYNSIAVDKDNHPHISYCDENTQSLKYAEWTGISWTTRMVDLGQIAYPSLKLDSQNHPHIAYCDVASKTLKYAEWMGTSWSTQTVAAGDDIGQFSAMLLTKKDAPQIFYFTIAEDQTLKYANWSGRSWHSFQLKRAEWAGNLWEIVNLDLKGSVALSNSIVLDKKDYPHIAYMNSADNTINYAKWTGKSWQTQIVTKAGSRSRPALTLDGKGNPYIIYYDGTDKKLKYAKLKK